MAATIKGSRVLGPAYSGFKDVLFALCIQHSLSLCVVLATEPGPHTCQARDLHRPTPDQPANLVRFVIRNLEENGDPGLARCARDTGVPQVSNKHRAWGLTLLRSLFDSGQPPSCPGPQFTHTRALSGGCGVVDSCGFILTPCLHNRGEGSRLTFPRYTFESKDRMLCVRARG